MHEWFLLTFATGVRCFVKVIISTHIYIVFKRFLFSVETNWYWNCERLMSDVLQTNIVYTKKYSCYKYRRFLQQLCYFLTIVIFFSYNNCCKNNN